MRFKKSISWNSYIFVFSKPSPNSNPNLNLNPKSNPNLNPNPNPRNSHTFKRMWLSFKVKLLQRKGGLFSFLTIFWHNSNNNVSFQRNTCAFHTKAFHEIHTYSFFSNPNTNPNLNPKPKPNPNPKPNPYLTLTLTLEIHTLSKQGAYLSK